MFFIMPMTSVLLVYVLTAILPAAFLMRYIYRKDTVEKEPPYLLAALVLQGVLAALASIILEYLGEGILSTMVDANSPYYTVLTAFLVVAMVEEGMKFLLLKRRTWRDPNFNYRFDGVVYAVFVSLGFAAFENLEYVFRYGLAVTVPRALLAIPGHMGFAVFMGAFYGRAKLCEDMGNRAGRNANLWAGYLTAVLLHGFYDACAMTSSRTATILFAGFVILMYILVIFRVRRESATDMPV
jgi:RsiW-degrading membrane proteinase PrsW (M82 family)